MDELKKGGRDVEQSGKENWRKADGDEDLGDKVGNAGDEIRKHLGNLGDDADKATDDRDRV
jgi:hypothetical protein